MYREAARTLGAHLVSRGTGLVYGGGHVGLMGALADAVLEGGGEVHGVIPRALEVREVMHHGLTRCEVVAGMHARKARMAALAEAFVALPGGFGTLEELLEMVSWAQLGIHRKPIGVLDVAGFFEPLLAYVDHAIAEGFIRPEHRAFLVSAREPGELLDLLETHHVPEVPAWTGPAWG